MQKIAGVKRLGDKNIYYFLQDSDYQIGDRVVVDFDEFQTITSICKKDIEIDDLKAQELVKIKRKATPADIKKYEDLRKKAKDNMVQIKRKSLELGLMMKFRLNPDYVYTEGAASEFDMTEEEKKEDSEENDS